MEETFTILYFSIPAFLRAASNDCKYSLCFPTPFVKKTFFGIIQITNIFNDKFFNNVSFVFIDIYFLSFLMFSRNLLSKIKN
jgi:hypothetical protein